MRLDKKRNRANKFSRFFYYKFVVKNKSGDKKNGDKKNGGKKTTVKKKSLIKPKVIRVNKDNPNHKHTTKIKKAP